LSQMGLTLGFTFTAVDPVFVVFVSL
jgi:hypothetical protein